MSESQPTGVQSSFSRSYEKPKYLYPVPSQAETARVVPSLVLEVARIKKNGESDMYTLPGTGWHGKKEVASLIASVDAGLSLEKAFQRVEQNIQGFKIEYLVEGPVFPILLEKVKREGKTRLAGKLYGGGLWVDSTDDIEREGAVKEAIKDLEPRIIDAKPGTMFVLASPDGWSGYQMPKGENTLEKLNHADIMRGKATEVKYPDDQVYCIQIQNDGSIKGFTLKNSMNLKQNEDLLMLLGAPSEAFAEEVDDKTAIKRVLQNVVEISPENNESIEGVAQKIKQIMGTEVAYKDSAKRIHTFSEMQNILKNPEPLWTLDETTQTLVDSWKEYAAYRIKNPTDTLQQDLEISLGLTVLKLMHEIRPNAEQKMTQGKPYPVAGALPISFNPRKTLENLQQIGGCAGGGNKNKIGDPVRQIINSITPRLGSTNLFEDEGQEWFTCPKCSFKADGPVGNQCPGCKITMEEYAQEEGAVVCA